MATVAVETAAARVRLVTNALSAGKTGWQISRHDAATGRTTLVRGGRNIPTGVTDVAQLFDYEYPVDGLVTYFAAEVAGTSVGTPAALAAAAQLALPTTWIKHTTRPYLNLPVRIVDYEPATHRLRPGLLDVLGRTVPVGRGDARAGRVYSLTVRTETAAELAALDRLLEPGGVLFVHLPATTPALPRIPYVVVEDAAASRRGRALGEVKHTTLTLAEVAAPTPDLAGSGATYAAAFTEWATYAAMAADPHAGTYADAAALQLSPGEVLIP